MGNQLNMFSVFGCKPIGPYQNLNSKMSVVLSEVERGA